jgi:hypothetical protein
MGRFVGQTVSLPWLPPKASHAGVRKPMTRAAFSKVILMSLCKLMSLTWLCEGLLAGAEAN